MNISVITTNRRTPREEMAPYAEQLEGKFIVNPTSLLFSGIKLQGD